MMEESGANDLQSVDLRKEFDGCVYTVFATKELADRGKPEFLKTKKELRADFKEYAIANENDILEGLRNICYCPLDSLFISYSLFEFVGSDFSKDCREFLEQKMLGSYMSNFIMLKSIPTLVEDSDIFFQDILSLIFPVVFRVALKELLIAKDAPLSSADISEEIAHEFFTRLNLFNKITTADKLLDMFFSEYADLKVTGLDDYLAWLYQSLYFLDILLRQDCTMLALKHVEEIVVLIKSKSDGLDSKELLTDARIAKVDDCIKILASIDIRMMLERADIYAEVKPLLFSLVLDILLDIPIPQELNIKQYIAFRKCFLDISKPAFGKNTLSQQQCVDIHAALFSLGCLNDNMVVKNMRFFTIESLANLVHRIRSEVLLYSCHFDCMAYLGFILGQKALVEMSVSGAEYKNFFDKTKEDFYFIFKDAMLVLMKLFYLDSDHESLHNDENDVINFKSKEFHKLFTVLVAYEKYSKLFSPAKELLQEFFIINVDVIDNNKLWCNSQDCFSFKEINRELTKSGMESSQVDFILIKKAFNNLMQKASSASTEIILSASDLFFWERLFEASPTMKESVAAWSLDKRQEIDGLFQDILYNVSLDENNSSAIFEARLCAIVINIISKGARLEIYKYMDKLLRIINAQHLDKFSDSIYQLSLIKFWLLEYVEASTEVFNSSVLRQFQVLPQADTETLNRLLYLCQLAEVFNLITKNTGCFAIKEELHQKIAKISHFILAERDILYAAVLGMEDIRPDAKSSILLAKGKEFLDQDFISLLKSKIPGTNWGDGSGKSTSRRNNYDILDIADISFTEDKMILHCEYVVFILPLANMPSLNILRVQVREYKKQHEFFLYAGEGLNLIPIIPENLEPDPAIPDEQLYALFNDSSKAKKPKEKAKNNKKKAAEAGLSSRSSSMRSESGSCEFAEDAKVKKSGKKNKKAKNEKGVIISSPVSSLESESSLSHAGKHKLNKKTKSEKILPSSPPSLNLAAEISLAKDAIEKAESFEHTFDVLHKPSISNLELEKIITAVQEKLGFKVNAALLANEILFSLGVCKLSVAIGEDFDGTQKLQQDLAKLPTEFLKSTGADSFASLVYSADGKVVAVASAAAFDLPLIGVKKGRLAKAIERLEAAFLNSVQDKLKVDANLEGATLSLAIALPDASIEDQLIEVSCDLRAINPEQLWPELLSMHSGLLQQLYGGNIALCKIVLDEENKIIAIDLSDCLPKANASLQRVEIEGGSLFEAYEEFFGRLDSASFKFFKNLALKEVEFILKVMQHADASLMIYGHPVIEHHYGDLLRALGVAKQPLQQLVVKLDSLSDIDDLRDVLTAAEVGAIIKGVRPEAIYCNYQGARITVCLGHNYMMQSIFNGDHFCSELEKGTLAYSEPQTNPVEVAPIVLPNQKSSDEIFMGNRYALKVALSWHKIMGKLGGGLRQVLQNLGFISVITAPELAGVTWQEAAASIEILPDAKSYLQAVFHLASEEDAVQVIEELRGIITDSTIH